ncbi:MAG: hypothetical protein ABI684_01045 [Nitrospirota bacterium]
MLLKIVWYGSYEGMVSSRRLSDACERNVQFLALSAATLRRSPTSFELDLIGRDTFDIDGCKLPSKASKQWSGTHQLKI